MSLPLLALLATVAAAAPAGWKQTYSFDLPVGSNSGRGFKLEGPGSITGLRTWDNGNQVFGIQLRFGDIWSARAGTSTGRMQEFNLRKKEVINQVSGKFSHYIHWLQFGTSRGRLFVAGQPSGQCFNFYPEHDDAELRIISGTIHRGLTGFSTHWDVANDPYGYNKGL